MEKVYTKTGYSITDEKGNVRTVTKAVIQKAIVDQTKMQENLTINLENLNADLAEIEKV